MILKFKGALLRKTIAVAAIAISWGLACPCAEAMADREPNSGESVAEERVVLEVDNDVKLDKCDINLKRYWRQEPLSAANAEAKMRVTVKTTDRGQELRQFLEEKGGTLGSCHGPIISAEIPYGALPALSRLETVTRIEGNIKLLPQSSK